MSLPRQLSDRTFAALADDLRTVRTLDLTSAMAPDPVGTMTVSTAPGLAKVVYVGLSVPPIGMDSHMLFAFTPADSAIPHFTLDAVEANGYLAFHLDLVPRAELASHLAYVNAAFQPLTPAFEEASELFGASRAAISPRQYAMMSPWMLVHRATEEQFRAAGRFVEAYLEHWRTLLAKGLPEEVVASLGDTDLAARDARNRANLFSREVDPVWANVSRLLGDERTDRIRAELITDGVGDGDG
ncbi:hypothetical protein J4573_12285 [Actinomadura barringtoniae]|uniref:Uncharacterized protein n=1 Tax=Actinomadura barringtoniae TaxID=1427535 RepID=A0A939PD51_9ACTN|nr:hypothetical protein [Actinomadura barringtoniae]MBO2447873.1 hypothetical protein [Actinomadura barringtoniae]